LEGWSSEHSCLTGHWLANNDRHPKSRLF